MDDLVFVMQEILVELKAINSKIDSTNEAISNLSGPGLYNNLSDVCDKIDSIQTAIALNSF